MRGFPFTLGALAVATLLMHSFSCREKAKEEKTVTNKGFDHWFTIGLEEQEFSVQVAVSREEKARGLMHRGKLPEKHGMLFVFREPDKQSFWMRNTRIPLDIGYFSRDGTLREIHAAQPFDERGYPSRNNQIQYVLELNLGAYRDAGLKPGSKLNLENIASALAVRGYLPNEFGLDGNHSIPSTFP